MGELRKGMSERELRDWLAFMAERPLPDELADIHNAMVCAMIANALRGSDQPPVDVAQFLVLRRREPVPDAPKMTEAERFKMVLGR